MDPLTLIITALTVGAASGIGDSASQIVKDAYGVLKAHLVERFKGNRKAVDVLDDHAADPDTYERPLAKYLEQANVTEDAILVQLAADVLEAADPEGGRDGKYRINVAGGQVGNIGDYGTVTMNIGDQH